MSTLQIMVGLTCSSFTLCCSCIPITNDENLLQEYKNGKTWKIYLLQIIGIAISFHSGYELTKLFNQ
jgi:hypothetical protein